MEYSLMDPILCKVNVSRNSIYSLRNWSEFTHWLFDTKGVYAIKQTKAPYKKSLSSRQQTLICKPKIQTQCHAFATNTYPDNLHSLQDKYL